MIHIIDKPSKNMRPIDQLIRPLMREAGFRLKGTTWYRIKDDFIQVFNFQKSSFGNDYYLNLSFDLADGLIQFPTGYKFQPEYCFPIRIRGENIPLIEMKETSFLFDSNSSETIKTSILDVVMKCIAFFDNYSLKNRFFSYFQDNSSLWIIWTERKKLIAEGLLKDVDSD